MQISIIGLALGLSGCGNQATQQSLANPKQITYQYPQLKNNPQLALKYKKAVYHQSQIKVKASQKNNQALIQKFIKRYLTLVPMSKQTLIDALVNNNQFKKSTVINVIDDMHLNFNQLALQTLKQEQSVTTKTISNQTAQHGLIHNGHYTKAQSQYAIDHR